MSIPTPAPLRPQSAEPSRLNPVEWADDFLRRDVSQQHLIKKYGLKVRLGESILAAMFEAYARAAAPQTEICEHTFVTNYGNTRRACSKCGLLEEMTQYG
jgi:hypothetical protein